MKHIKQCCHDRSSHSLKFLDHNGSIQKLSKSLDSFTLQIIQCQAIEKNYSEQMYHKEYHDRLTQGM